MSPVNPSAQFPADLFPDEQVQFGNQTVVLQQRKEYARRNQAPDRMVPAHKGFQPHNPARVQTALRLGIKYEFPMVQPLLHLGQKLMVFLHLPHHTAVIPAHSPGITSLHRCQGYTCPIVHGADGHGHILDAIYPKGRQETGRAPALSHIRHDPVLQFPDGRPVVRDDDDKIIPSHVSCNSLICGLNFLQMAADPGQKPVPLLLPIPFIKQLEVLYIHCCQTVCPGLARKEFLCPFQEHGPSEQPGHGVEFRVLCFQRLLNLILMGFLFADILYKTHDGVIITRPPLKGHHDLGHPGIAALQAQPPELSLERFFIPPMVQASADPFPVPEFPEGIPVLGMDHSAGHLLKHPAKVPFHTRNHILVLCVV